MLRVLTLAFAAALLTNDAAAQARFEDRVGDTYEIRAETISETSSDSSSGRSQTVTTLVERVVALHSDGVELEFDLPEQAAPEDRARTWQLPARVLKLWGQPLVLLNGAELDARVQTWLDRGDIPREACGRWVFTWTAIRIECDPQSALEILAPFDLRERDLSDGAEYSEAGSIYTAPLRLQSRSPDGTTFVVVLQVDPEIVRRQRAETDVAVAEMMRQEQFSIEDALHTWRTRAISGAITITFETDAFGRVVRRTHVTRIEIRSETGSSERQTTTSIVERRSIHSQ